MVRTNNILLSTLALSACCVAPTKGFMPETATSRTSHVRLDLSLEPVQSTSSVVRKPSEPLLITVVDDDQMNDIGSSNLPPVLQQITDERRNFQVNLGKAMDTLRKDLPYILKETPGKFIIDGRPHIHYGFLARLSSLFRGVPRACLRISELELNREE